MGGATNCELENTRHGNHAELRRGCLRGWIILPKGTVFVSESSGSRGGARGPPSQAETIRLRCDRMLQSFEVRQRVEGGPGVSADATSQGADHLRAGINHHHRPLCSPQLLRAGCLLRSRYYRRVSPCHKSPKLEVHYRRR